MSRAARESGPEDPDTGGHRRRRPLGAQVAVLLTAGFALTTALR